MENTQQELSQHEIDIFFVHMNNFHLQIFDKNVLFLYLSLAVDITLNVNTQIVGLFTQTGDILSLSTKYFLAVDHLSLRHVLWLHILAVPCCEPPPDLGATIPGNHWRSAAGPAEGRDHKSGRAATPR